MSSNTENNLLKPSRAVEVS